MTFASTDTYRSKDNDWHDRFRQLRADELRPLVTKEIVEEFRRNPRGRSGFHSDELHKVLCFVRSMPLEGFPIVYAEKPYETYRVAELNGRRQPINVDWDHSFSTEEEAEFEVFLRRLNRVGLKVI